MAPEEFERFMREISEFKGRVEEAQRGMSQKYTEITASLKTNYECLCTMKATVDNIQKELAIQKAVQKVKNTMYGAFGGIVAAVLVQVLAAFLKLKLFGGN